MINRIVYKFVYLIANFSRYLSTLLSFNLVTFLSRNLENQEFLLNNRQELKRVDKIAQIFIMKNFYI